MRKFLLILFVLCITDLSCFAIENNSFNKCSSLVEQAKKTNNDDIAIKALECNIKLNKNDLSEIEKKILENTMRSNIVTICANRYELTQNKKYIDKALKYAFEAINNDTKDVQIITSAIALGAANLDTEKMLKAYDYLGAVNPQKALSIKNEFIQLVNEVRNKKQAQADLRRQRFVLTTQVLQQTTNDLQRNDYLYNRANTYNVNVSNW